MRNDVLVSKVLETSGGSAPDMTHALSVFGGGNMGAGIQELWYSGQKIGLVKGVSMATAVFTVGLGVGLFFWERRHKKELEEVEAHTLDTCLEFVNSFCERKCRKCMSEQKVKTSEVGLAQDMEAEI